MVVAVKRRSVQSERTSRTCGLASDLFEAVCKGGKKTKTVAQLMTITGFTRVKVLQLGGRLADQRLVHKTKRDGQTAHAKDRYLAAKESSRYLSSYPNRD